MDNAPHPGANPKEAAKWNAAAARIKQADNPQTVSVVSTQPDGTITRTIHQAGKRDPIWKTNTPPEQPPTKWSLSNILRRKPTEPPPPKP